MSKLKELDKVLISVTAAALLVIIIVAGRYIWEFSVHVLSEQDKWGQFGDYFGGVLNPIFSFFAFVAILYTLRTQVSASEEGERRHVEQLREQRLFQLMGLVNENALGTKIIDVAFVASKHNTYALGHQAQNLALIRLSDRLAQRVSNVAQTSKAEMEMEMEAEAEADMKIFKSGEQEFKEWRKTNWDSLGLYLGSVFLVLEFIVKESSSEEFKKFSMNMLRMQLTESERLLVWYTAMFTADYAVYLSVLLQFGFIEDHDGSQNDKIKPWRETMTASSRTWSNIEMQKRN